MDPPGSSFSFSETPVGAPFISKERDGRPETSTMTVPSTKQISQQHSHQSNDGNRRAVHKNRYSRSRSSSSASTYRVLFSTASKYDKWSTLLLSIAPLLILSQMITLLWTANEKIVDFERSQTAWCLGWALIFVVFVYMLVLPKQVDVRSNGTIGVKTFLITYQFDDICHAYPSELGRETMLGARYRFATCFKTQIVIRRRGGKFDVVLSPERSEEFLQTLQSVITKLELERGTTSVVAGTETTGSSSTDVSPTLPTIV